MLTYGLSSPRTRGTSEFVGVPELVQVKQRRYRHHRGGDNLSVTIQILLLLTILALALSLLLFLPWIISILVDFPTRLFSSIPNLVS